MARMLDFPAVPVIGLSTLSISQYLIKLLKLFPPFYITRLPGIIYIYIYVNESRHMNVGNPRKSCNLKQRNRGSTILREV